MFSDALWLLTLADVAGHARMARLALLGQAEEVEHREHDESMGYRRFWHGQSQVRRRVRTLVSSCLDGCRRAVAKTKSPVLEWSQMHGSGGTRTRSTGHFMWVHPDQRFGGCVVWTNKTKQV